MNLLRGALASVGFVLALSAHAHDPGLSTVDGRIDSESLHLTLRLAPSDARQLLGGRSPSSSTLPASDWVQIISDGTTLESHSVRIDRGDEDNVAVVLTFPRPRGLTVLKSLCLSALPRGHRQFITVHDDAGIVIASKLLSSTDPQLTWTSANDASGPDSASLFGFVWLGVQHILTGYDHLLFLLALLITSRDLRSVASIVTCFTVAHSITLALATLNIVHLPSRPVEIVIALSIVYVALENLFFRDRQPKLRWLLTICFGLVHGFGFAGVLGDLGIDGSAREVLPPLLSFNMGVELGQLAIAATLTPVLWKLRERPRFVPAISCLVAAAGAYWIIERAFFD